MPYAIVRLRKPNRFNLWARIRGIEQYPARMKDIAGVVDSLRNLGYLRLAIRSRKLKVELMPMPLAGFHEPLPRVLFYNAKTGRVSLEDDGMGCLAFQTNVFYVNGLKCPKEYVPPAIDV